MKALKKSNSVAQRNLNLNRKSDIECGYLFEMRKDQIPGYLSVKIDNYDLEADELKFFGVSKKGAPVSGLGVPASKVDNQDQEEVIALFNIEKLVQSGQFTEDTVEGVITLENQELGRDEINTNPGIYLG
ncbi:hypothetical protein MWH28_06615 [Natroniella sulfidigena]|uniref:hypothetical protein n=1 Tax=Natroniella sulfidigena TaxID=723921 RepID=UPI00200A8DD9|nr:hypothetical protein [Natroniella sulfidigena]MCK8817044.1 hypothetical protein [Natroniella sulfidigena]